LAMGAAMAVQLQQGGDIDSAGELLLVSKPFSRLSCSSSSRWPLLIFSHAVVRSNHPAGSTSGNSLTFPEHVGRNHLEAAQLRRLRVERTLVYMVDPIQEGSSIIPRRSNAMWGLCYAFIQFQGQGSYSASSPLSCRVERASDLPPRCRRPRHRPTRRPAAPCPPKIDIAIGTRSDKATKGSGKMIDRLLIDCDHSAVNCVDKR
jgi:hypothetical protein